MAFLFDFSLDQFSTTLLCLFLKNWMNRSRSVGITWLSSSLRAFRLSSPSVLLVFNKTVLKQFQGVRGRFLVLKVWRPSETPLSRPVTPPPPTNPLLTPRVNPPPTSLAIWTPSRPAFSQHYPPPHRLTKSPHTLISPPPPLMPASLSRSWLLPKPTGRLRAIRLTLVSYVFVSQEISYKLKFGLWIDGY